MAVANPEICEGVSKDFPSYIFTIEITEVLARIILCHANGFRDLLNFSSTCNGASFHDVYAGKYEVVWRIKQENKGYQSPVTDAEISYTTGDKDNWNWNEEVSLGKIYKYNPETVNQWVEVSTGCIKMEKCGTLSSRFQCLVRKPLPF